jgi:UDP-2-acetamido-2-deoxy-ribo-hexuluronate aminotransferase
VIALLQLTPVLVDVDPINFNIDIDAIRKAITPKTKAIVPVHLFGLAANMDAIMEIAKEHNLYVIEDNAQGIGADYTSNDGSKKKTGGIGHVGSTSFFPSKNLGCYGDGGAIFTNDDDLAHSIRGIVNHGMYERYHHDVVGVNSRLDSIQAAVLRAKLPNLDAYNATRREAAQKYNKAFAESENIITPSGSCSPGNIICASCDCHVFHQYTLRVLQIDRDALAKHLNEKGIPCGVYYPIPLHLQKAYRDTRYKEEDFPVTNQLVQEVISLPMHTELDDEQIDFITRTVIDFATK